MAPRRKINAAIRVAVWTALVWTPVFWATMAPAQQYRDGVDPRLCQSLIRHRPAPDVEYTPGVDVRGRAVAPADLPGSAGADRVPLERFEIPVTLDFARRMGFSGGRAAAGAPAGMEVGRLTLDGRRLSFNGQPISGASEAALMAACGGYR